MGNACCAGPAKGDADRAQANGETRATEDSFKTTHKLLRKLGDGATSTTYLYESKLMSKPCAIKLFNRPLSMIPEGVIREIMVQTDLGPAHVNLIDVYCLFLAPDSMGLVMELGNGGAWTSKLGQARQRLVADGHAADGLLTSEEELRYYFRQLISAVAFCHSHGVAHRDLKPDNILLDGNDPPMIKICDFGFSRQADTPAEWAQSQVGTQEFMSPELIRKAFGARDDKYDAKSADMWACGIIILLALCAEYPYDSQAYKDLGTLDTAEAMWRSMREKSWKETKAVAPRLHKFSPEVIDLLDNLLALEPEKRPTPEAVMQHPWYNGPLSSAHQKAWDKMEKEQAALTADIAGLIFDEAKKTERNKRIKEMVEKSATAEPRTPSRKWKIGGGGQAHNQLDLARTDQILLSKTEILKTMPTQASFLASRQRASITPAITSLVSKESAELHEAEKLALQDKGIYT